MKHKILFILLLISSNIFSQQKGLIYYGYVETLDIGNAKGQDSNAYMVFNNEQSYYVTAKDSLETLEKINERKTYSDDDDNVQSGYDGMKVSKSGDRVVYNIKKNTMWSNFLYGEQIYVKEVTPKINWKIEKETKKIGKFTCKKATAFFRGRNYTAWFTSEIPLQFGPWKLCGLPGLILEAYDTKKFVYWYFKSVEYPTKSKEKVKYLSIPKNKNFKTYAEYQVLQKEEQDLLLDKQKMAKKKYPDVIFGLPKISEMFIEFE